MTDKRDYTGDGFWIIERPQRDVEVIKVDDASFDIMAPWFNLFIKSIHSKEEQERIKKELEKFNNNIKMPFLILDEYKNKNISLKKNDIVYEYVGDGIVKQELHLLIKLNKDDKKFYEIPMNIVRPMSEKK